MRKMAKAEIPAFVQDVAATGCDIRAIDNDHYVIGDVDLSPEAYEVAEPELDRIWQKYGDHEHLKLEIVAYLHSIGRSFPPPTRQ